jgi:hypothetical protein
MESALTPSDVMLMTKHRGNATATTGVALAAGLGGGALLLAIAGLWGMNAASKARSRAAEQIAAANSSAIDRAITIGTEANRSLASLIAAERGSRETWQSRNQPTIGQYVDVQTNPNLNASLMDYVQTMANAQATASAVAQANAPLNSAVGTESFLRVQRYSAPLPCGCDSCNG